MVAAEAKTGISETATTSAVRVKIFMVIMIGFSMTHS
jgi:hypothetical protein